MSNDGSGGLVVYGEKELFAESDLADYPNYFNVGITYRDPRNFDAVLFKRDTRIKCSQAQ